MFLPRAFLASCICLLGAVFGATMNPPQGLKLISATSNSVTISWATLVPSGTETITAYRVQYQKLLGAIMTLPSDVQDNFVTISSLDPCSTYLVSVAGIDSTTNPTTPVLGPYSMPISVKTYAPAPTGAVTGAVATVINAATALVTITDANNLACTKPATGTCGEYYYRVSLTSGDNNYVVATQTTASFVVNFMGLTASTAYTPIVQVIERFSNQAGPVYSGTQFTTTAVQPQTSPVQSFSYMIQDNGAALIRIRKSSTNYIQTSYAYNAYLECTSTSSAKPTIPGDTGSILFTSILSAAADVTNSICKRIALTNGILPSLMVFNPTGTDPLAAPTAVTVASDAPGQVYVAITPAAYASCENVIYMINIIESAAAPSTLLTFLTSANEFYLMNIAVSVPANKVTATVTAISTNYHNRMSAAVSVTAGSEAALNTDSTVVIPAPPTLVSANAISNDGLYLTWTIPTANAALIGMFQVLINDLGRSVISAYKTADATSTSLYISFPFDFCSNYSVSMRSIKTGAVHIVSSMSASFLVTPMPKPTSVMSVSLTRPAWNSTSLNIMISDPYDTFRRSDCESFQYSISLYTVGSIPITTVYSTLQSSKMLTVNQVPLTDVYQASVKVLGLNMGSSSDPVTSNTVDMAISKGKPTVPQNLAASSVTSNSAVLTWSASTANAPYWVNQYTVGLQPTPSGVPISYTINSTSQSLTGLFACTSYSASVEAFSGADDGSSIGSGSSAAITFSTPAGTPNAVRAVYLKALGPSQLTLTIDDIGQNCPVIYTISLSSSASTAPITLNLRSTSYSFTGLSPSTNYQASVVTVYSANLKSATVNSNTVTTPSAPYTNTQTQSWAVFSVKMNNTDGTPQTYNPLMALPGSTAYSQTQTQFCSLATLALQNSQSGLNVDNCQLVNILPGSVVATGNLTLSSVTSNSQPKINPNDFVYRMYLGSSLTPPRSISNVGAAFDLGGLQLRQVSAAFAARFSISILVGSWIAFVMHLSA